MRPTLIVTFLAVLLAAPMAAASKDTPCLRIDHITTFAPRGQIYVEVSAACRPEHFEREDPIIAYLEVFVGEDRALGDDVRVYSDAPNTRSTYEFRDLDLESEDVLLVRLTRFGNILGIRTTKVP